MNGYIAVFATTYDEVTVVDAFTKTGGFNRPASYDVGDGLHPSVELYKLEAGWISDVISAAPLKKS